MNITTEITTIATQLLTVYNDYAVAYRHAWHLFEAITNKSQSQLLSNPSLTLSAAQHAKIAQWLDEIITQHKPIEYCIGSVPFLDLSITIQPPILIPRPDTEFWCNFLIQEYRNSRYTPAKILDLCTGSGCIGLALAKAFPSSMVYATDISKEALACAQHNAQRNNISHITFLEGNLFEAVPPSCTFDLIVSNPPYISELEFGTLEPSVARWEDPRALVAPENGYAIINKIIEQAPRFLHTTCNHHEPELWIEIGHQQASPVCETMLAHGFHHISCIQDLAQRPRVVRGSRPHGNHSWQTATTTVS